MLLGLAIGVGTIAVGAGLAFLPRGTLAMGAVRTFAVVASITVVLGHLLPEAFAELGSRALLGFLAGVAVPALIERGLGHRHVHLPGDQTHGVGFELGYYGLLLHAASDGIAFWAYSQPEEIRPEILLALAAHAAPLTTVIVVHVLSTSGSRLALYRGGGLAVAVAAGVFAADLTPGSWREVAEPWIGAVVGGLLLHVIAHGLETERPISAGGRALDLAAGVAGLLLPLIGGLSHAPFDSREILRLPLGAALTDLALASAPTVLIGLAAGAWLQSFSRGAGELSPKPGSHLSQAARGVSMGMRWPLAATGTVSVARALNRRGAPAALVGAFLLATPQLGIETVALSVQLLGAELAMVRLVAAIGVAWVGGAVIGLLARSSRLLVVLDESAVANAVEHAHHHPGHHHDHDDAGHDTFGARFLHAFDELVHHTTPWLVLGLLAAAHLSGALAEGALGGPLDALWVGLLALPAFVRAPAAVPLFAVLLVKGLSPGAAVVGLVLGPALSLTSLRFLRSAFGARATLLGLAAVSAAVGALAWLANTVLRGDRPDLGPGLVHGPLAIGATLILGVLLLRSVWISGVRGWIAALRP